MDGVLDEEIFIFPPIPKTDREDWAGIIKSTHPWRKVRKRKTPKPPFSLAEVELNDPLKNLVKFAVEKVKLRLQEELGNDGGKATNSTTAPFNKLAIDRDDLKVGDEVPSTNARQVLVAATWRSGSSFFGELLSHYPGVYYSYEPLHTIYTNKEFNNDTEASAKTLISSLLKCSYNDVMVKYLRARSKWFWYNFRVWSTCKNVLPAKSACFLPLFYRATCPLFPIRIVKTVRMRVQETEALLRDPELANLKVVVLVRDPRGVMNSRATMNWCKVDHCANAEVVCEHLDQDLKSTCKLQKRWVRTLL